MYYADLFTKFVITPIILGLFPLAGTLGAEEASCAKVDRSQQEDCGMLRGEVVKSESGDPLPWVNIYIEELGTGAVSHEDGRFVIRNIPEGEYMIQARYTGFETLQKQVEIVAGDTTTVDFAMRETVFRSPALEIVGRRLVTEDQPTEAEFTVSGRELRRDLSRTISETLSDEPGLAEQGMGPASARPVLRGLGGERLMILEDGGRTGDLSATSSDHALAIEPMTAEEIEVVRGPSALRYGSNTMGGVINVIRQKIPLSNHDHHHGNFTSQAESVNSGLSGGISSYGPVTSGNWSYRADGSARNSGDIITPEGDLENTGITTYNASLGISNVGDWGLAGISASYYTSDYGVPGGFTGAHPNGVTISMERFYIDTKARFSSGSDRIRRFEVSSKMAQYRHEETLPQRDDVVGAIFGVLTYDNRFEVLHNGLFGGSDGVVGLWGEFRNFDNGGGVFTPNSLEYSMAGYAYENFDFDRLRIQAALRYDIGLVEPKGEHTIRNARLLGFENTEATDRTFNDFSASLSATYNIMPNLETGTVLMRTFRAPGIEELYSDGPHLGAYTFEIGNPDLETEIGYGAELFTKYATDRYRLRLAAFRNQARGYIFSGQVAERAPQNANLPLYQFQGERVLMTGIEGSYEFNLFGNFVTGGTLSYVQGDVIDEDRDMPFWQTSGDYRHLPEMPPLNGRALLEYRRSFLTVGGAMRFAAEQNRTGRYENPTEGYQVFDFYAEYRADRWGGLHTLSLNFENAFNSSYYNHLNRIREIMPEPGRNIKLLYRFYF